MVDRQKPISCSRMLSFDGCDASYRSHIACDDLSSSSSGVHPLTEDFKADESGICDTPETYLTGIPYQPDITIFCDKCQSYIDIQTFRRHRMYHNALLLFDYDNGSWPVSHKQLLRRRHLLIKNFIKEAVQEDNLSAGYIQEVNDAFEMLCAHLQDESYFIDQLKKHMDVDCTSTATSLGPCSMYVLGMSSSDNCKYKDDMEDAHCCQDFFGGNRDWCYIGLFDGHHGKFSADLSATFLHRFLLHQLAILCPSLPLQQNSLSVDVDGNTFHDGKNGDSVVTLSGNEMSDALCDVADVSNDVRMLQHAIELCEQRLEKHSGSEMKQPLSKLLQLASNGHDGEHPQHPQKQEISTAFKKSYQLLDTLLSYGKDEVSKVRWSGCSSLSILIETISCVDRFSVDNGKKNIHDNRLNLKSLVHTPPIGFIHLANSGVVRALLVRGNRPYRLSKHHSVFNARERNRIIENGGQVTNNTGQCLLNGVLHASRGLGYHGDPSLRKQVLVGPYTASVAFDEYAQFVVMATSGVWEVFSDEDVVNLLTKLLPCNQIQHPDKPSSSIKMLFNSIHTNPCVTEANTFNSKQYSNSQHQDLSGVSINKDILEKEVSNGCYIKSESDSDLPDYNWRRNSTNRTDDTEKDDGGCGKKTDHAAVRKGDGCEALGRRPKVARDMAEHLVQASLMAGSHSNITVVVLLLPGSKV